MRVCECVSGMLNDGGELLQEGIALRSASNEGIPFLSIGFA